MKIWPSVHNVWWKSWKVGSSLSNDRKLKINPHGWLSKDNAETLKHNAEMTEVFFIPNRVQKRRKNDNYSNISEWELEHIDKKRLDEKIMLEINWKVIGLLKYDNSIVWFSTNRFWMIAFSNTLDKYTFKRNELFFNLLDEVWKISIKVKWWKVSWNTMVYVEKDIKNSKTHKAEAMPLNVLFDYLGIKTKNFEIALLDFLKTYEIEWFWGEYDKHYKNNNISRIIWLGHFIDEDNSMNVA